MNVDTWQRRNTHCRTCKRFFVIDETNKDNCPYCEIERLRGEIAEAEEMLYHSNTNGTAQIIAATALAGGTNGNQK